MCGQPYGCRQVTRLHFDQSTVCIEIHSEETFTNQHQHFIKKKKNQFVPCKCASHLPRRDLGPLRTPAGRPPSLNRTQSCSTHVRVMTLRKERLASLLADGILTCSHGCFLRWSVAPSLPHSRSFPTTPQNKQARLRVIKGAFPSQNSCFVFLLFPSRLRLVLRIVL